MLNTLQPRHKLFMQYYQATSDMTNSAIKAGFSEQYARKQGKKILNTALRLHTQQIVDKATKQEITAIEAKTTMLDILGLSREQVVNRLKTIAMQDKDYSSALKVLQPVSKSIGYDISTQDTPNITVPVLNIVVDKQDSPNNKDIIDIQQ